MNNLLPFTISSTGAGTSNQHQKNQQETGGNSTTSNSGTKKTDLQMIFQKYIELEQVNPLQTITNVGETEGSNSASAHGSSSSGGGSSGSSKWLMDMWNEAEQAMGKKFGEIILISL